MNVTCTLEHSALTRSGTGSESFAVKELPVLGMYEIRFYSRPNESGQNQITIRMDARTLLNAARSILDTVGKP